MKILSRKETAFPDLCLLVPSYNVLQYSVVIFVRKVFAYFTKSIVFQVLALSGSTEQAAWHGSNDEILVWKVTFISITRILPKYFEFQITYITTYTLNSLSFQILSALF